MNTQEDGIEVEMLTQERCGQCEEAKRILQGSGIAVTEFSQQDMYGRENRAEIMAALADNDCRFPVMCLKGSGQWTGNVLEILQEVRERRERDARVMERV